jgi:hypothetical protein
MVALQNRQNKGVTRRIVQDKELRDVSASFGRFRLEGGAKKLCRDDDLRETSGIIMQRQRVIIRKHLRCGQRLALRSRVVRGISGPKIRPLRLRSGQALGHPLCTEF